MTTRTPDTTGISDAAVAELRTALGADRVQPAGVNEAAFGARWVVRPTNTDEVAAAMRVAAAHDLAVLPRGAATKLDWASFPERTDLVCDVSALSGIVEHAASDLVLRAGVGTTLAEIDATVREAGQQLAIEHPIAEATVGGVIATAESGPSRHYFGSVRDLLIGITVVCADGTVATSGGKVVKNVAGYDLGKLYAGSFGTLGVITEAIFRLHPVCGEHRWLSYTVDTAERAASAVAEIRRSQTMPTAVELDRQRVDGSITVCAQLEGTPGATQERAVALAEAVTGGAREEGAEIRSAAPDWWGWYPFDPAHGIGLRVGAAPAELGALLETIRQAAHELDLDVAVRGAAGLGVLHIGLSEAADVERVAGFVADLRSRCAYAVVLRAPAPVRTAVDMWGPVDAGKKTLLRRTKQQFDPDRRLAPGRFVGGI